VSVFKFRCNILISGKIIKEMPRSVASGAHGTKNKLCIKLVFVYTMISSGAVNKTRSQYCLKTR